MKKFVVPALVVAGFSAFLLVGATSVSWAQESAPSCAQALAGLTDAQSADAKARQDDRLAEDAAKAVTDAEKVHTDLAAARAELAAAVKADNETVPPLTADSQRTKDAKAAVAKLETDVAKLPDLGGLRTTAATAKTTADKTDAVKTGTALVAARAAADKACTPATTTTTPPPADNDDPADLNCGDFPLSDGRTAQQVLDADRSDPNILDVDQDGLACEAGDLGPGNVSDGNASPSTVDSVVTPVGGVETGGGPE